ncbi:MAG: class I SAM-dependent methyltransferase [Reichenbachiella sp.]|uniref:class I SAM-dependent methyltransferase n=1 Tax=Reichenbachiella sp. TaxID=2184521 RepID=UPI003267C313
MKTSTETLNYPEISSSQKLLDIAYSKILGQKKDYFLPYKYEMIKQYYGQKCLDIGAGNGSYSEYLRSRQHDVTSLDVVDKSNHDLARDIQLFNGKDIPFLDKTFDTSLLMFVLHHTNVQNQLIQDCIRVTRKYIIIAEDIIRNQFDLVLGAIHLHSSPWDRGNDSFKTHAQWKDFFDKHKLELVETVNISRWTYPIYPVTRKIYVLKVNK